MDTPQTQPEAPIANDTVTPRRSLWRRLGCWLLVAIWFLLLLSPCVLIYLAANGEIRLWHADIPQAHAHPLLLISLISESRDRGLRLEWSSLASQSEPGDALCVDTQVRFVLWQSSGVDQGAAYCDCYERRSPESAWRLESSVSGVCGAG